MRARGAPRQSLVALLVVLRRATDKRRLVVENRRVLADMPVCKDIIVTTHDEITRRGDLPGSVLRPALSEGKGLCDEP